ncbi:SDR family NAD(P)-dependent oxidoreductase [Paracandidimonas soli]|uniref:3-oxoacyl-[acyl-carrier protein] reductase n=1 Tax=Paracandidimonas soli TaxID=1917182 RepID=A0A4R3VHN2_9BURK|nr:SDR family oxidoreductase [Paracandidimonas soli]TCV03274.1 3-oxoacyl-[acyl-carrier protein] reductase [Paracandidimonas soli]
MLNTSFAGKRVFVTGATGLLGMEISQAFAHAGATLMLTDCVAMTDRLKALLPESAAVSFHVMDLSDSAAIHRWVESLSDAALPDVVVNNAGIYPFHDLLTSEPGQCARIFDINTMAPLSFMQAFGKRWIDAGKQGSIVNVSSASSEVARTNGSVYGASKAALEQLTRMFAIRLGRHGIRVNAVRPGIAQDADKGQLPADHLQTISQRIPLGRTLAPGELSDSILFLASQHASFVTGQVISVDGGGSINRRLELIANQG